MYEINKKINEKDFYHPIQAIDKLNCFFEDCKVTMLQNNQNKQDAGC